MSRPNGFGNRPRPTRTAYCEKVADMIRALKKEHRLSNIALGERIGADDDSICNWENERTVMGPIHLLAVEHEFGPGAIDCVLEIAGSNAVGIDESDDDALPTLSAVVTSIAWSRSPRSDGGVRETVREMLHLEHPVRDAVRSLNGMLRKIFHLKRKR